MLIVLNLFKERYRREIISESTSGARLNLFFCMYSRISSNDGRFVGSNDKHRLINSIHSFDINDDGFGNFGGTFANFSFIFC